MKPILRTWLLAFACALATLAPARARAQDPSITVGGLVDTRFVRTDSTRSWLDGGLGKTRYGAGVNGRSTLARVSQLSLLLDAEVTPVLFAHVQVNADAEPDRGAFRGRLDLIEAFALYRPELAPHLRLRIRAGTFFPPVSLENDGPAWTSTYTITTSGANSWIGEEVRTIGAETTVVIPGGSNELRLTGAGYGSNDTTGTLLAWRGWALHDRQTGFGDRLPLADLPSLRRGGAFQQQAPWTEPMREVDGRLGYYAGVSFKRTGFLEVRGLYYDNRAIESTFDGQQYAWKTRFANLGVRIELLNHIHILAQHMRGTTLMGRADIGNVNARFATTYGLVSGVAGRHRLSVRYERFDVEDEDGLGARDDNREDGEAWTAAYVFETGKKHRLALEVLHVESDRAFRASLGLPVHVDETLVQASFRLAF